jgi:hypothetical protein
MTPTFHLLTRRGDGVCMVDFTDKAAAWAAFEHAIGSGSNVYLYERAALIGYVIVGTDDKAQSQ